MSFVRGPPHLTAVPNREHAESPRKGRGATFTVDLPLASRPASPGSSESQKQTRASHALSGIRVLLVDDDRDIGEVLQYVLAAQGALVTVARSAAEALTALARSMPTVLLSDLSMPGETGHDLVREIVAREGPRPTRSKFGRRKS